MARNNPMVQIATLKRMVAERETAVAQLLGELDHMKAFTVQQSLDMAHLALGEAFGFGPERQSRFESAFKTAFMGYAKMCVKDSEDDEEIWYTQEILDRGLRSCCGADVPPFRERYAQECMTLGKVLKEDTCNEMD